MPLIVDWADSGQTRLRPGMTKFTVFSHWKHHCRSRFNPLPLPAFPMTVKVRPIYRLLLALPLAIPILAGLLAGAIWLALHGSLPRYKGTVEAAGLAAPVTVERDALGSATIRAQDRHDMVWALGYVHAQ